MFVVTVVYFHRVIEDLGDPNSTLMGPHDSCTQVRNFASVGRLSALFCKISYSDGVCAITSSKRTSGAFCCFSFAENRGLSRKKRSFWLMDYSKCLNLSMNIALINNSSLLSAQAMINLMLTGRAAANVFNGDIECSKSGRKLVNDTAFCVPFCLSCSF